MRGNKKKKEVVLFANGSLQNRKVLYSTLYTSTITGEKDHWLCVSRCLHRRARRREFRSRFSLVSQGLHFFGDYSPGFTVLAKGFIHV